MRTVSNPFGALLLAATSAILLTPNVPARGLTTSVAAQKKITVPAGTRILIRTADTLDSKTNKSGARFTATLETNLEAKGMVIAKRGTTVYGRLLTAKSAGR